MPSGRLAACAAVLLAVLLPTPAGAAEEAPVEDTTWSAVTPVAPFTPVSSRSPTVTGLRTTPDGRRAAAVFYDSTGELVWLRREGGRWLPPTRLSSATGPLDRADPTFPLPVGAAFSADLRRALVVWATASGSVRSTSLADGAWTPAVDIPGSTVVAPGRPAGSAVVTLTPDGTQGWAAWTDGTGTTAVGRAAHWSGGSWGTAEGVTTPHPLDPQAGTRQFDVCSASTADDGSRVLVTWAATTVIGGRPWSSSWRREGTWQPEDAGGGGGCPQVSLSADGTRALATTNDCNYECETKWVEAAVWASGAWERTALESVVDLYRDFGFSEPRSALSADGTTGVVTWDAALPSGAYRRRVAVLTGTTWAAPVPMPVPQRWSLGDDVGPRAPLAVTVAADGSRATALWRTGALLQAATWRPRPAVRPVQVIVESPTSVQAGEGFTDLSLAASTTGTTAIAVWPGGRRMLSTTMSTRKGPVATLLTGWPARIVATVRGRGAMRTVTMRLTLSPAKARDGSLQRWTCSRGTARCRWVPVRTLTWPNWARATVPVVVAAPRGSTVRYRVTVRATASATAVVRTTAVTGR